MKENGDIDSILNDTNTFKEELFRAKANSENNILEIENTVDANRSQFEEEFKLIIQHLNDLKTKFLDELSTTLKRGREELSNQILTFEDGILCIDYCKNAFQMAKDADSNTERVMKFHKALEQFKRLKSCQIKETNVQIDTSSGDLASLKNIAIVKVVKTSNFIEFDINNIELLEFKRFQLGNGEITSGFFLSDGNFLVVNRTEKKCLIYDKEWNCCHVIEDLSDPRAVTQREEEIFVTAGISEYIEVYSSQFQKLKTIPIHYTVCGITSLGENLYVTSPYKILEIDNTGIMKSHTVNTKAHLHIISTKNNLIVYSVWKKNEVVAMDATGRTKWKYKNQNLESPHGLDVDSRDRIYVAGTASNNVHVLSNDGELIRVIENIYKPVFFKVNESERVVCVGTVEKEMVVYKF